MTASAGPVAALHARVLAFFRAEAASFGLAPERVAVDYVLNPGGFVNDSFRVSDGDRRLHLKLSRHEHGRAELRRWYALGDLLSRRHRGPQVLAWIDLGDDAGGLLFEHVPGTRPALTERLLAELLPWQAALASDEELRDTLRTPRPPTALEIYEGGLLDRAREDLAGIRAERPPWLADDVLAWMADETERLHARIVAASCFRDVLDTPVHADLWLENLLVAPGGRWWVLDWDGLAIGDPVLDLATLTGPSLDDPTPLKHRERVEDVLSAGERERLAWWGRATLLDWVIDPLADWVEATVVPERMAGVRAEKERIHRGALELYLRLYGGG